MKLKDLKKLKAGDTVYCDPAIDAGGVAGGVYTIHQIFVTGNQADIITVGGVRIRGPARELSLQHLKPMEPEELLRLILQGTLYTDPRVRVVQKERAGPATLVVKTWNGGVLVIRASDIATYVENEEDD